MRAYIYGSEGGGREAHRIAKSVKPLKLGTDVIFVLRRFLLDESNGQIAAPRTSATPMRRLFGKWRDDATVESFTGAERALTAPRASVSSR